MTEKRWTTLPDPNGPALVAPEWASEATKQLAAETCELFDATRAARAEAERLKEAVGIIDPMTTSVDDLVGAGGMARQAMIEALRDELLARSKFAEFLAALEVERLRAQTEALERIDEAKQDARAALLGAGFSDLEAAVTDRGKPDNDTRAAWNVIVCSFPSVGQASATYRQCRSLMPAVAERASHNRKARTEVEASLRKMLETMAAAVG